MGDVAQRHWKRPIEFNGSMRDRRAFGPNDMHGLLNQPGTKVSASSEKLAWCPLFVSVQREGPFSARFRPCSDELLIFHRSGPTRVERVIGDRRTVQTIPAGGVQLIPSGKTVELTLFDELDSVHIYIRRRILEKLALELLDGDPAKVQFRDITIESDPALGTLIKAVVQLLSLDGRNREISAYFLASAIAAHLVQMQYTDELKCAEDPRSGKIWSRSVGRAIKYMRENLDKPLKISEIADAANKSESHMARLIRQETGMSIHQYLVKLRTEKAGELLDKTNMSIAEIACICGFSHQEHLTNTFRRTYSITPAVYRRSRRARAPGNAQ